MRLLSTVISAATQERRMGVVRPSQCGATLLEVMIALLVFSLGLLGLAGMLVVSIKVNRSAYLLTQASFLAQSMADRMHGNLARVWSGDYSVTYPTADSTTVPCASGAACSRANVATRDKVLWSQQLTDSLPQSAALIGCVHDDNRPINATDQAGGAPFAGLCTITITWNGESLERVAPSDTATTTNAAVTESFTWKFQP
jgi:type IV pilus assembly protein PilV